MDPALLRLAAVLAVIVVTTIAGRTVTGRRSRLRRVDTVAGGSRADGRDAGDRTRPTAVAGASAVLFGSPTCAPCETLKRLLGEVERGRTDFDWRYVDAADHLDLAREHGVRTVPTLLVLDRRGRVVARTTGVPALGELEATVAAAADPLDRPTDADQSVVGRTA